ncbi:hypothetical protein E2562_017116 [Oryza meyeriana var. granulata]|uniref:Uncharacterized protein n=1 Tax=Oryza meyeriana var. granulata TaxID=110450 RepID=A0A6G1DZU2_9ORYZ|nr:hypothetical protein E2562_017116 [Oryza meyeriana var. granulata]
MGVGTSIYCYWKGMRRRTGEAEKGERASGERDVAVTAAACASCRSLSPAWQYACCCNGSLRRVGDVPVKRGPDGEGEVWSR